MQPTRLDAGRGPVRHASSFHPLERYATADAARYDTHLQHFYADARPYIYLGADFRSFALGRRSTAGTYRIYLSGIQGPV